MAEDLEEIGSNAFASSGNISTVNLPSTLTTLGENEFAGTSICEMIVPDKVMNLPAGSCGNPSVLTLGSGVKTIDANAGSDQS